MFPPRRILLKQLLLLFPTPNPFLPPLPSLFPYPHSLPSSLSLTEIKQSKRFSRYLTVKLHRGEVEDQLDVPKEDKSKNTES
jgi:hypothetical protein